MTSWKAVAPSLSLVRKTSIFSLVLTAKVLSGLAMK